MKALAEPLECLAGDARLFDRNWLQANGEFFQKRIQQRATHFVAVAIHEDGRLKIAGYGEARRAHSFDGGGEACRLRFPQENGEQRRCIQNHRGKPSSP